MLHIYNQSILINWQFVISASVTDGHVVRTIVSVIPNVLSWSGGHDFVCVVLLAWVVFQPKISVISIKSSTKPLDLLQIPHVLGKHILLKYMKASSIEPWYYHQGLKIMSFCFQKDRGIATGSSKGHEYFMKPYILHYHQEQSVITSVVLLEMLLYYCFVIL